MHDGKDIMDYQMIKQMFDHMQKLDEESRKRQLKLKEIKMENFELKNRLVAKQAMVDDRRDVFLDNSFLKNRTLASPDLFL